MEPFRVLLLFGWIAFALARASVDDYLDEQLRQTKIELAKLYFRDEPQVQKKVYNVKWDTLWKQDLGKERPFTANAFDKLLLVEGNRIVVLSFDAPTSNQTLPQEITLTHYDKPIKFVRSIVWKGVLYLLICYESRSCSLYTGTDDLQLRHRQSIQQKGYPTDASFFVRENRLYLVVADNSGQFIVPSLIYHWRSTYMDVVAEVMTIAAVSVTTFKYKQSTIIVFAQNDKTIPDIGSMVYEFKEVSPEKTQFLDTSSPTSVHHYNHAGFDFVFLNNERGPSNLFWWDDHELLKWQEIAEIKASSLIHLASIEDATFFFVGHDNTLELYKFENASDCTLLSSITLLNEGRLVDIQVRINKSTIILVLVIVKENNIYAIETWKLRIDEIPSDYSTKESDILSKHLEELIEILKRRKPLVEEAESLWPSLFPADEDLTITEPLALPNLILDSGTVENIDVFVGENVSTPAELQKNLEKLTHDVDRTLTLSKNLSSSSNTNSLNGNITVDGDAEIEELQIDKINVGFINNVDLHPRDVINSNKTEESPLEGKNVVIRNLKVDSICGIPFQYWSLTNDTSRMIIDIPADKIEFSNDTIVLHSNVSLESLNVETLNGIDVDELFSELFIIHQNQRIKGNVTYNDLLTVQNLKIQTLDGEPFENYMTTNTDQHFDSFLIRSLKVDDLYADSINGVAVSEAARISTENVIEGEVKIASLHVTDKLTLDSSFKFDAPEPHPIYYNVTIYGNLKIGTLDLDDLILNNQQIDLNNIFKTFWTKSTDQVIESNVTFESNLIIDHLQTKYLNGLTEDEYLYTNVTTIPENFRNLHFENVHIDGTFFVEGETNGLFDVAPESLTIQEALHFKQLRTNQLFTNVFNGLSTTDILNGKPSVYQKDIYFPTIRAKQVNVQEMKFHFFNGIDSTTLLDGARNLEGTRKAKSVRVPRFHVKNLNVERINDIDLKKLVSLKKMNLSDLRNLVIDGDLTVKGNLKIDRIDNRSAIDYLREMAKQDIVFDKKLMIDELTVQNASFELLHGYDMNDLFERVLSKSREQVIPGNFSFYKITTTNVDSKFINDKDTSDLKWTDEPLFLTGNVTFDHLFVEGDVTTGMLNDRDVNELYNDLLNLSIKNVSDLKVDGNVSWSVSSINSSSWTWLFENALTKTTNQNISGDVVFENDVSISSLIGRSKEIDEINDIVADAVIDDEGIIEIIGPKVFKKNLVIDSLLVSGDVNIPVINNISILEFNDSVVRKDQGETVTGTISFFDKVAINEVVVDGDHNVPLDQLVLATDILPKVTFKELVVLEDVYLKNLDGIDFDKFVEDRITIDRDHEIFADVQFNGIVEVTKNASVRRINGIDPSDLVLNGTEEAQIISGSKIFEEDLVVHGNIYTKYVNGRDLSLEYSNGIQTDQDVEIIGDLIFKSRIEVPQNVSVSNLINGIKLDTAVDDLQEGIREALQTFARNETAIKESIRESMLISSTLGNVFSYIEENDELQIQAPNIKKVDVVYHDRITKLNMIGEELGSICGLPNNCFCPTQYVAELLKEGCRIVKSNNTTIVRNYYELNNSFGVNVTTNTISSSSYCTSRRNENEFTTISWVKPIVGDVKEIPLQLHGFVKDAKVFSIHSNAAFVVLAIYYDTMFLTHRTNSLLYKIDFEKNLLSLHQILPTDGAWDIEIFQINHREMYLLLGCFGTSEVSVLYRLDPVTSTFIIVRIFGGKTRNVKSLFQENDHFILLDDYDTNAVNIFQYYPEFDNFYDYQSLFYDSPVNGIECFYADEYGQSDSFVIVTTENDQFYIYEYMYAQKFQMRVNHRMDNLQTMVPFNYLGNRYIFIGTNTSSTILTIVRQGPH